MQCYCIGLLALNSFGSILFSWLACACMLLMFTIQRLEILSVDHVRDDFVSVSRDWKNSYFRFSRLIDCWNFSNKQSRTKKQQSVYSTDYCSSLSSDTHLTGSKSKMITGKTILTYAQGEKPKKHMTPNWINWQNVNRCIFRWGHRRM